MKLLSGNYKFEDSETGELLVEAPAMDMYCLIGLATDEIKGTRLEKMKHAAEVFNREFGSDLSWGQVVMVLNKLDEEITSAKKNSTPMPELPDGTE